jgi:hypothetical protein
LNQLYENINLEKEVNENMEKLCENDELLDFNMKSFILRKYSKKIKSGLIYPQKVRWETLNSSVSNLLKLHTQQPDIFISDKAYSNYKEYHTESYDIKFKSQNHSVKYFDNKFGAILCFFKEGDNEFAIIREYEELRITNIFENIQKQEIKNIFLNYFYDIFKFMKPTSRTVKIKINNLSNKCVKGEIDEKVFMSEWVETYDD